MNDIHNAQVPFNYTFLSLEQIFKTNTAHWWSPDGNFLAFGQFDDSQVKKAFVTSYFDSFADSDLASPYLYPREEFYGYPKVIRWFTDLPRDVYY